MRRRWRLARALGALLLLGSTGLGAAEPRIVPVGSETGYDGSNVNVTSFRTDPLATFGDQQFVAFYDPNEDLILGKRTLGSGDWTTVNTGLTAGISDAHRVASLAVDGDGYLHLSWGMHNEPLNYVRSTAPGALTLTDRLPLPGVDLATSRVTYPEFFHLPDGNLLFTYRLGSSGNGDTYIQHYERSTQTWTLLQNPALFGRRPGDTVNAYPNGMVLDGQGRLHWSWTWREESGGPDANKNQLYARSPDLAASWERGDGSPYAMPITEDTAEIVRTIPTNSYIANQCHMAVDRFDRPMIAQYYDPGGGRRIMLTWFDGSAWRDSVVTEAIGWTRPLVLVDRYDRVLIFFVEARKLRLAYSSDADRAVWDFIDLADEFKGNDPTFDRRRFELGDGLINIFYQHRIDGSVNVLEWDPDAFLPPADPATDIRAPRFDTYVRDGIYALDNYGTDDRLLVKDDREDFNRESYLRLNVAGLGEAESVSLTLTPIAVGVDAATTEVRLERIDDDGWDEAAMNWNNRPPGVGTIIASHTGFVDEVPVVFDITSAVRSEAALDGVLSLRIVSAPNGSGHIVHFASREHADESSHPRLEALLRSDSGPGAVDGLALARNGDGSLTLAWNAGCLDGALGYGIYEGAIGDFASHTAIDCFDDGADRVEVILPAAGDRYYLVAPYDGDEGGSLGRDSAGAERAGGAEACRVAVSASICP